MTATSPLVRALEAIVSHIGGDDKKLAKLIEDLRKANDAVDAAQTAKIESIQADLTALTEKVAGIAEPDLSAVNQAITDLAARVVALEERHTVESNELGAFDPFAGEPGAPGLLVIGPDDLPDAIAGQPYVGLLTATGGAAPYHFSVSEGALPDGLKMADAGLIGGVPSVAGINTFTGRVHDANGTEDTAEFEIEVVDAPVVVGEGGDTVEGSEEPAPVEGEPEAGTDEPAPVLEERAAADAEAAAEEAGAG